MKSRIRHDVMLKRITVPSTVYKLPDSSHEAISKTIKPQSICRYTTRCVRQGELGSCQSVLCCSVQLDMALRLFEGRR